MTMIHKNIILSDTSQRSSLRFKRDGRQCSSHHYSNFPLVGVHAFQFKVLQLILCFHSSYLKKVLEMISF